MIPIEQFFEKIASIVLEQNGLKSNGSQNVIKQHTEKLRIHGDFGFPTTLQAWLHFTHENGAGNGTKKIIEKVNEEQFIKLMYEIGAEHGYPIENVKFQPFRCLVFLRRDKCIGRALRAIIFDDPSFGKWYQSNGKKYHIFVQQHEQTNLSEYRCATIAKVLVNLLKASGFEIIDPGNENGNVANLNEILVTYARQSADRFETNNNAEIVCGTVKNRSGNTVDDLIQ